MKTTNNQLMNLVIVGHVDHGKSTLIGRLLYDTKSLAPSLLNELEQVSEELGKKMEFAYLLDALQEEREQQKTIQTTQTFFSSEKRDYVIIDAPGHKELIKNMVTGASLADIAVLVVDAKEGLRDQTKRHAFLLNFLGIKKVIVAINKMDLVNYENDSFVKIRDFVQSHLSKIGLEIVFSIPISAINGDNIVSKSARLEWFDGPTLLDCIDATTKTRTEDAADFRFSVQDVYSGESENIIAGRVENGIINAGDRVFLSNSGGVAKIKDIIMWPQKISQAEKGMSLGLTFEEASNFERGVILYNGKKPSQSNSFRVRLFWLSQTPWNAKEDLLFRCNTQETTIQFSKIYSRLDSSSLQNLPISSLCIEETNVVEAEILAKKQIVYEKFDKINELGRFVLEKDNEVVAGGVIII